MKFKLRWPHCVLPSFKDFVRPGLPTAIVRGRTSMSPLESAKENTYFSAAPQGCPSAKYLKTRQVALAIPQQVRCAHSGECVCSSAMPRCTSGKPTGRTDPGQKCNNVPRIGPTDLALRKCWP